MMIRPGMTGPSPTDASGHFIKCVGNRGCYCSRESGRDNNSPDYPGSVRWQHFSRSTLPGDFWAAFVTARAALPQIRVEMLIGSQAKIEITN